MVHVVYSVQDWLLDRALDYRICTGIDAVSGQPKGVCNLKIYILFYWIQYPTNGGQ